MPMFEYICRDCQHQFETLVTGARQPEYPECHNHDLEKQLSVFAVSAKSSAHAPAAASCGTCGDPRGPSACSLN